MKLSLDNIGSICINGRYYAHKAFEVRCSTAPFRVWANETDYAVVPITGRIDPCLSFDGPVWLNCWAWDAEYGTWHQGGYLETISCLYRFISTTHPESYREITFPLLGLRPAAYAGGVRVDGLDIPAHFEENTPSDAISGHRWIQMPQGASRPQVRYYVNSTNRYLYASKYDNYRTPNMIGYAYCVSAWRPTSFANNIYFERYET